MPTRHVRIAALLTALLLGAATDLPAQHRVVLRGQRFTPERVVATVGDSVRFELESGAPHNVAFYPDSIPSGALAPLARNLGSDPRYLFTPDMLLFPGEAFVLRLAGLPPGTYVFYCAPHVAGGMRGELVIRARAP
jgi:plastocyanin